MKGQESTRVLEYIGSVGVHQQELVWRFLLSLSINNQPRRPEQSPAANRCLQLRPILGESFHTFKTRHYSIVCCKITSINPRLHFTRPNKKWQPEIKRFPGSILEAVICICSIIMLSAQNWSVISSKRNRPRRYVPWLIRSVAFPLLP